MPEKQAESGFVAPEWSVHNSYSIQGDEIVGSGVVGRTYDLTDEQVQASLFNDLIDADSLEEYVNRWGLLHRSTKLKTLEQYSDAFRFLRALARNLNRPKQLGAILRGAVLLPIDPIVFFEDEDRDIMSIGDKYPRYLSLLTQMLRQEPDQEVVNLHCSFGIPFRKYNVDWPFNERFATLERSVVEQLLPDVTHQQLPLICEDALTWTTVREDEDKNASTWTLNAPNITDFIAKDLLFRVTNELLRDVRVVIAWRTFKRGHMRGTVQMPLDGISTFAVNSPLAAIGLHLRSLVTGKVSIKLCALCGILIQGRKDKDFCSDACRMAFKRKQQRSI